jgi:hypothetical protein
MKTTRFFLLTALIAAFSLPSFAQLKVDATGKVGIGTSTPARKLEVQGVVMISNNATYPGDKQSNFLMRHQNDPNVHFAFFNAQSSGAAPNTENIVLFGGGAGAQYSATTIGFLTAPTSTTLGGGTERMRVTAAGQVRINSLGGSGAITEDLNVVNNAAKAGGGTWATLSDKRVKSDVRPFTDGLKQVLQIKPVFFHYTKESGYDPNREHVGIIAQEMQKIAPYTVEEVKVRVESDDKVVKLPDNVLKYDGTAVTYMLINAIQEQHAMIEERDERIEDLEARLQKIEQMLAGNNVTITNPTNGQAVTNITLEGSDAAMLKQNAPNPFSENTTIEYVLPKSFGSAYIQISNVQGAVLRKVALPQEGGAGTLNIKAKELPAGEYVYSLVVDGKMMDTKKMVLATN